MEPNDEDLKDRLLARLPRREELAEYRRQVAALMEKNEKKLRREKFGVAVFWIYAVAFFILALTAPEWWQGGKYAGTAKANSVAIWMGAFALFQAIAGAAEIVKHFINRARVELLKETKQLQLLVLRLEVRGLPGEGNAQRIE